MNVQRAIRARLARAGVDDVPAACAMLAEPALAAVLGTVTEGHPLLSALARAADPDAALASLVKLCTEIGPQWHPTLREIMTRDSARRRLIAVLGSSLALAEVLCNQPEVLQHVADDDPQLLGPDVRAQLLVAVGADPAAAMPVAALPSGQAIAAMRRSYRAQLVRLAARDLSCLEAKQLLPQVGAALAQLANAALEAGLAIARSEVPAHEQVRLAVITMGKTGGGELNYVSDVDVMYVVAGDCPNLIAIGSRLAAAVARTCSAPASERALWVVDANLRPEGKDGPLVRTLPSYLDYYRRWASTWEFQALLKACTAAGDSELGEQFVAATRPLVWSAVSRENFVTDCQAMRRRVEANISPGVAQRQLKLGAGGLRDVEFTVQLLQLVHGRLDESLQARSTLAALAALTAAGYVGRTEAAELDSAYRLLRVLEHRIQVYRMRRSHVIPTDTAALRRLGRALGLFSDPPQELDDLWRQMRRTVRSLHERIYYRPLLPATAQLSPDEAALAPAAARARLASVGYRDPAAALRHMAALTEGMTRRAAIQRQLLPVLIGWFAEGADPDAGLAAFRRLSDELGTTHWYLGLLRDSGMAAHRLARLLSTSVLVAQMLARSPESVRWLADDGLLAPLAVGRLRAEANAIADRATDPLVATMAIRGVRRRENSRIAAASLLGVATGDAVAQGLADTADTVIGAVLKLAKLAVGAPVDFPFAVIAMGRLGGREVGYGSDADVMFVAADGGDESDLRLANQIATKLRSLLQVTGSEPALDVDADLRPEGRNGPLVRRLSSYGEYYQRWSAPWEAQALLRARAVAGDEDLGRRFEHLIDPVRYPPAGLSGRQLQEIRRLKVRIESERLPRGADPARHLKLGRGGLVDVEWVAQLLQLQFAGRKASLRTTSTLDALSAGVCEGLLAAADEEALRKSWLMATAVRNAVTLATGRIGGAKADVLPHERRLLAGVARIMGYPPGAAAQLEEDYLRTARHARAVVERVFYQDL